MFLHSISIEKSSSVTDMIRQDYRTADIFMKYGINFFLDGEIPLGTICGMKGIDFDLIKKELENSIRTIQLSNSLQFNEWSIDFLTKYIVNIHHQYLRDILPKVKKHLDVIVKDNLDKYPFLADVQKQFNYLHKGILPHIQEEEEVLFPYIRQISHAYESKESYASLLVRTLRKPVEDVMHHDHETVFKVLQRLRELTNNYTPPKESGINCEVTFLMLKELDSDLVQHVYLENNVLFPKAIAMEKELLR